MSLNTLPNVDINEEREKLLKNNPDILFGVYNLNNSNTKKEVNLSFVPNVLTCYDDQFEKLIGMDGAPNISIISLNTLRKGQVTYRKGDSVQIDRPVLLSPGVVPWVPHKNNQPTIVTTLRDTGGVDQGLRTTTAGRGTSANLRDDLRQEAAEESPYLVFKDGKYCLYTSEVGDDAKKWLKDAVNFFLNTKYLSPKNENYKRVSERFNETFGPLQYSNLGSVLEGIIENDRIITYDYNVLDIGGNNMKTVLLDGKNYGKFFVFHDTDNNTFEVRELRYIPPFLSGVDMCNILYTESIHQYPKVLTSGDQLVPALKALLDDINKRAVNILKCITTQGEQGN